MPVKTMRQRATVYEGGAEFAVFDCVTCEGEGGWDGDEGDWEECPDCEGSGEG